MTENENTTVDTTIDPDATPVYAKGSWQESLHKSSALNDRSQQAKKKAGAMLWDGAQTAIEEWLPTSDTDVSGEGLYNAVKTALGAARKGDANKIKTVALAVKGRGLILSLYPNLSKAYGEAKRLTETVQVQADEDDAADKAISGIEVPKSTTTVDGAAAILLGKGIDGAVVAILDALGANNEAAHRAFMRAVSVEIAARVQAAKPKPAPKSTTPKTGATKAGATKAAVKAQPAKAKQKGKPVGVAVKTEAVTEAAAVSTPDVPVATAKPSGKGRPVVRRPARSV